MTDQQIVDSFAKAVCIELNESLRRIHHCLDQITDEQVRWRPEKSMNSIANLILHLCGNVRQWIISGVGGADDTRDRQQEFDDDSPYTKDELISAIDATVAEASTVIMASTAEQLERVRVVQGREVSGFLAIIHSVTHFQGHVQEVAHITRTLIGNDYVFAFVPESTDASGTKNAGQKPL